MGQRLVDYVPGVSPYRCKIGPYGADSSHCSLFSASKARLKDGCVDGDPVPCNPVWSLKMFVDFRKEQLLRRRFEMRPVS